MKIRILRGTTIKDDGGGSHVVAPGDVADVDQSTANLLIGMGKAESADKADVLDEAPEAADEGDAGEVIEDATAPAADETADAPRTRKRRGG